MDTFDSIIDLNSRNSYLETPGSDNSDNSDNSERYRNSNQLQKLINGLKEKIRNRDIRVSKIKYPKLLLVSLNELNNMIGMHRLKESVALQIMSLIKSMRENEKNISMLNTILYGPPGVGKSKIGVILAKIWYSLGFLNGARSTANQELPTSSGSTTIHTTNIDNTQSYIIISLIAIFLIIYLFQGLSFLYDKIGIYWLIAIVSFILIIIIMIYWASCIKKKNSTVIRINNEYHNKPQSSGNDVIDDNIITVVSRQDFVADYVGQTSGKTMRLLMANMGKVLFIDEAYSLLNDSRDPFGIEALTTLNLFLSQNPDSIVVIFAGYEKIMKDGIFTAQPGLPRRCIWHFECEKYNGKELFQIFMRQLSLTGWTVEDEGEVESIFEQNMNLFKSYGGDTERLCFYAKLEASREEFLSSPSIDSNKILTVNQIKCGIDRLKENNIHKDSSLDYDSQSDDKTRSSSNASSEILNRIRSIMN
jgi:hypothetical protein